MEYELKFKIKDAKAVLARLDRLGARDLGRRRELDIYIGPAERGLRLRKYGRRGLVTYKQLIPTREQAKVRREVQTEVADIEALIEIFRMLGFPERRRKEKIRRTFRLGRALVLIDRLPFLDQFVEIEAASVAVLHRTARKLGFDPAKGLCDSYDTLFLKYYAANVARFRDPQVPVQLTFRCEKDFPRNV